MTDILLTNDDGITAKGLLAVYKELKKIGRVNVVAPDSEKSSVGHGITLSHPLFTKEVKRNGRFFGYAVSGNPADCIKLAVGELLKKRPDIIVSGINLGPNDGCSVFYSGTIAGAREGAIMGIPSVAVSLATFTDPHYELAARFTAKLVRKMIKETPPEGTFLNVNIPNQKAMDIKGVKFCRQGRVPIHGYFEKRADPSARDYYWMSGKLKGIEQDINADTYALENNFIAVTPVHCDATDYSYLETLRSWTFPPSKLR